MTEGRTAQMKAQDLLLEASKILKARGEQYGDAQAHYDGLADIFNTFFYTETTPRDVVMRNVLEKLDRIRRTDFEDPAFKDSFIDAINYLAIAWAVS